MRREPVRGRGGSRESHDVEIRAVTPRPVQRAASSEEGLVAGLRAGDESAFERLVRDYGGALLGLARRILGNEDDAADALQEALLSAFRKIQQFTGESRVYAWLHRIVVNASLMKLRKKRRLREQTIESLLPQFKADGHQAVAPRSWPESGEELLARKELRQLVREHIARLPEKYRDVLLLRDIAELDTAETAGLLGIEVATVKTRVHRGRQALKTLLDPHLSGAAP